MTAGRAGHRLARVTAAGMRSRIPRASRSPARRSLVSAVDLYWLPLGAGGHFVRWNGRVYETVSARWQRRPARDLYHSALQIQAAGDTFVIEQAPVPDLS